MKFIIRFDSGAEAELYFNSFIEAAQWAAQYALAQNTEVISIEKDYNND